MSEKKLNKNLPSLAFSVLMLMTFGNLGTSMAFALQSANMGRIFQTLGGEPNQARMVFHPAAISRDGCSTTGRLLFRSDLDS